MKLKSCLAVAASVSVALPALGDITLVSRRSHVAEAEYDGGPLGHSDEATYTAFGAWDRTLQRGHRHNSSVDSSVISAGISGGGSFHPVFGSTTRTNELDVHFNVSGSSTSADITFSGRISPFDGNFNVRFWIQNLDTGINVFEIHRDGDITRAPEGTYSYWTEQTVSVGLDAGRYRLFAHNNGSVQEHQGPGQGSQGGGSLSFTTTFVPAPAAPVLFAFAALARRRR